MRPLYSFGFIGLIAFATILSADIAEAGSWGFSISPYGSSFSYGSGHHGHGYYGHSYYAPRSYYHGGGSCYPGYGYGYGYAPRHSYSYGGYAYPRHYSRSYVPSRGYGRYGYSSSRHGVYHNRSRGDSTSPRQTRPPKPPGYRSNSR